MVYDQGKVKLSVGVDLDDVCYSFIKAFIHFLVEFKGYDPDKLPHPTRWEFHEDWGMTLDEWLKLFAEGVDAGVIFLHGEPFEGAIEAINRLRTNGHTIHIVTHRTVGDRAVQNTMEWLQRVGLHYDSLTFAKDKTVIKTDVFIEDNIDNFEALWEAGTEAYLINRPHNENYDTKYRVNSWEEFEQQVYMKAEMNELVLRESFSV